MSGPRDSLNVLSRIVFGEKRFLAVAFVIAEGSGTFSQTDIARTLMVSSSSVQGPLDTLVRAGFVTRHEPDATIRTRRLTRNPSAIWTLVRELEARTPPELTGTTDTPDSVEPPTLF